MSETVDEVNVPVMCEGVLERVNGHEYNGVWKLWKGGSLLLFAVFVGVLVEIARTLRQIARAVQ